MKKRNLFAWVTLAITLFTGVLNLSTNISQAATSSIKVQISQNNAYSTSTINPNFKIINTGSGNIDAKDIKIRYYYTVDDKKSQTFLCDWSTVGITNVAGTINNLDNPTATADCYLEITFKSSYIITPNNSISLNTRIYKTDYSNYDQNNDYSFTITNGSEIDAPKVPGYISDSLVWGAIPVNDYVITASSDNPPYETKDKAFDGNNMTKWLSFKSNPWIQIKYKVPVTIYGYAITAANDNSSRDPKGWILYGLKDNGVWEVIDNKAEEKFNYRFTRKHYFLTSNKTYKGYKFKFNNQNGIAMQLSEIELLRTDDEFYNYCKNIQISFVNKAPNGGGKILAENMPNLIEDAREVARKVSSQLYQNTSEIPLSASPKLTIEVPEETDPACGDPNCPYENCRYGECKEEINTECHSVLCRNPAWVSGSNTEKNLGLNPWHLREMDKKEVDIRFEVLGMLYHELAHVFQYDENPNGYENVEGMADAIRFYNGHHDRFAQSKFDNWKDQSHISAFYCWINSSVKPTFFYELNQSMNPGDGIPWTENVFEKITGKNVNQLWSEYQSTL